MKRWYIYYVVGFININQMFVLEVESKYKIKTKRQIEEIINLIKNDINNDKDVVIINYKFLRRGRLNENGNNK